jgi:hypothetical protein
MSLAQRLAHEEVVGIEVNDRLHGLVEHAEWPASRMKKKRDQHWNPDRIRARISESCVFVYV